MILIIHNNLMDASYSNSNINSFYQPIIRYHIGILSPYVRLLICSIVPKNY